MPGVTWNTIRTPSTVSSCPVWVMSTVGASSPTDPSDAPAPSPMPTRPVAETGTPLPVWYIPRRSIAVPA